MTRWICFLLCSMPVFAGGTQVQIASPARDYASFNTVPLNLLALDLDFENEYAYVWQLSTGERYEGANIIHELDPAQADPVTATMTATNLTTGSPCEPDSRIFYPVDISKFSELPAVTDVNADAPVARPGQVISFTAEVTDPIPSADYTLYWFWIENGRAKRFTGDTLQTSFAAPGDYTISVVVKDSDGNYGFSNYQTDEITVQISEAANLPPTAEITDPAGGVQLFLGDSYTFSGRGIDPEGETNLQLEWTYLNVATFEEQTASGVQATFTFSDPGIHQVRLKATDSLGNVSPNEERVFVQVVTESDLSLFSPAIQVPSVATEYFVNDPIVLIGTNTATSGIEQVTEWEIRDVVSGELVRTLQGSTPGRISLTEPGLYELYLKGYFGSRTSEKSLLNVRHIAIQERYGNQPPSLLPTSINSQYVRNGEQISLSLDAEDPEGDDFTIYWILNGEITDQRGTQATFSFDLADDAFDRGISIPQSIRAIAIDSAGSATAPLIGYSVYVYKDPLMPEPIINNLPYLSTVYLPLGSPYPLSASLADPYDGEVLYNWSIFPPNFGESVQLSEQNPRPYTPLDPGIHYVILNIESADGTRQRRPAALMYLYVFDLSQPPQSNITKPNAERIVIETQTQVTLEGQFSDANIATFSNDLIAAEQISHQFNWEISGPNGYLQTFEQEEPLTLDFAEPGTYTASFYVSNSLGLLDLSPDTVTIEVTAPRNDTDFEPNDTRDLAAEVDFGNFGGLSVSVDDPVDWYRFCLEEAGSAVAFNFDLSEATSNIALQLFLDENLVEAVELQAGGPVKYSFVGAEAGIYYLRFAPTAAAAKKKTGLDFSIAIEVSTPRLIFPYPKTDEVEETELLLINPSNGDADVTLVARSFDGGELAKSSMTMGPGAHWTRNVSDLFPNVNGQDLGWVQVLASRAITGLSTTTGLDNETALAEPALSTTLEELVVPHIAQATAQWYTRAAIINNSGEQVATALSAEAGNFAVDQVSEVFQSAIIDFEAFFGGSLPGGSEWASFVEGNAKTNLAGMELFGTKLGSPRVAGLNLANARVKDPGFTYVRRNLYFPHVAGSDFWTGIAFVNISNSNTDIRLLGYDNQGQVLAETNMTLAPFAKEVRLAYQFFDNLAVDAGLAWIALETDGFVQGYELFGDNDSDATVLSGFPAVTGGSTELTFRKVHAEENVSWTGIAVVNIATSSEANLVYEAIDAEGRVLGSSLRTIGALRKDVALVQNLFNGGLPEGTAWVRVSSDQPIAGFQLYGDLAGRHMAGVLAQ